MCNFRACPFQGDDAGSRKVFHAQRLQAGQNLFEFLLVPGKFQDGGPGFEADRFPAAGVDEFPERCLPLLRQRDPREDHFPSDRLGSAESPRLQHIDQTVQLLDDLGDRLRRGQRGNDDLGNGRVPGDIRGDAFNIEPRALKVPAMRASTSGRLLTITDIALSLNWTGMVSPFP